MEWFWKGVREVIRRPTQITGVIMAVIGLGSAFGWWNVSDAQYDSVLTFLGALLVVFGQFVTPTGDPVLVNGQKVKLVRGGTGTVVLDE